MAERRVYGGQSAAQRDDARRTRIHRAVIDIVGVKGYAALTVGGVCTRAQVSTRHFYEMYPNKDAAFADVYNTVLGAAVECVVASMVASDGCPPHERAVVATRAFVEPLLDDPALARLAFVEAANRGGVIEEAYVENRERLIAAVTAVVTEEVRRGAVTDRDFRLAVLAVSGGLMAIAEDWLRHRERYRDGEIAGQLAEFAARLIVD